MERVKTKKEIKYYEKLAQNVFSRKNKFFRRNVHLNHNDTFIKIIRIKNDEDFENEISGFKEIPRNICFLIYHIDPLLDNKKHLHIYNSDYIITDSKTNKVISINQEPKNYPDFFNVWIVRKSVANFLNIKINDILFTR